MSSTKSPVALKPITFWLPREEAQRLDAMLGARVAGLGAGAKASRQAYLRDLIRRDLEARAAKPREVAQ